MYLKSKQPKNKHKEDCKAHASSRRKIGGCEGSHFFVLGFVSKKQTWERRVGKGGQLLWSRGKEKRGGDRTGLPFGRRMILYTNLAHPTHDGIWMKIIFTHHARGGKKHCNAVVGTYTGASKFDQNPPTAGFCGTRGVCGIRGIRQCK